MQTDPKEIGNLFLRHAERKRKELIAELIHEIEHPEPTVPTGLPKLDEYMDGGIRPGEVFLLAARPRVGKSAFALQIAIDHAKSGKPVSIWSLEMMPRSWMRRAACSLAGVNPKRVRRGTVTDEEICRLSQAWGDLEKLPLLFAEGATDPDGFMAEAEMHVAHAGTGLLILDYAQLLDPPKEVVNREQQVASISRTVKKASIEFSIPIILLAQLNRNAEGKIPSLDNLRESGALEQDPDEVFFLHRDTDPDRHVLQNRGIGILAKNRDGECGMLGLTYIWQRYRFEESYL